MKHGDFVWHDLMTTDVAAAANFYSRVIGWSAADSGLPGRTYMLFSAGPAPAAGLMPIPDPARAAGAKPKWMGYIGVGDVDSYADKVTAAGGAIHRGPEDIPDIGRFAVAADPHGGCFHLFEGNSTPPEPFAPGTPGTVGWNELHAGDGVSAFEFYASLFGWTKDEAIPMGPMGIYQLFASGGPAVGAIMTKMPHEPAPSWLFYFNVEAIDAAAARATEGGGAILHGPVEVPGGQWIVQCVDPQGALFAMVAAGR